MLERYTTFCHQNTKANLCLKHQIVSITTLSLEPLEASQNLQSPVSHGWKMVQEDQLLLVLMTKRLRLPVDNGINFCVEPIVLAKTQRLASFRPAASGTMNILSDS